ncbi:GNAT family N-acetyltransferase [Aerococcaceae bacterium DSM 111020]|nr:GNAT family N-acetyltransferase [Aerococcaceae bacterium DSM 111020]
MENLEIIKERNDMFVEADIIVDKKQVGWIEIVEDDDEITIADLQIYDEFQNQGIGTAVLNKLIDEHYSVTLAPTDEDNLRLYQRVGFEEATENAPEIDQGLGVWTI